MRKQALFVVLAGMLAFMIALPKTALANGSAEPPEARNIDIIRRHHDAMNSGDIVKALSFYSIDTRNHGRPVGRAGVTAVLTDIYRTFPDWRMDIVDIMASGDQVVTRMNVTGTHKGIGQLPVNGGMLVSVAPTQNSFSVQHIHWYTLKNGLIVEHRANRDDIGMMQQLGLLPAAPAMPRP